jgi:hypothetical protein
MTDARPETVRLYLTRHAPGVTLTRMMSHFAEHEVNPQPGLCDLLNRGYATSDGPYPNRLYRAATPAGRVA